MQKFLENKKVDLIHIFLVGLTIFFFVISPIAQFANTRLGITISTLALIIIAGTVIALLIAFNKKKYSFTLPEVSAIKKIASENYPLLISLVVYFLLHALNFYFYVFIPEWDSYGDLINIQRILFVGFSDATYRPLFTMSTSLLSSITTLSPYYIFSIVFVAIQSTILLVTYKFLKIYEIKNKFLQLFFLLGIISIPVMAMEIDMTRPQNIFLIFFPVYIYFFYEFLTTKKYSALALSSLIAFFGQDYHEFFIFILAFHLLALIILGYKKFITEKLTPRKISLLAITLISLIALIPKLAIKIPLIAGLLALLRTASQRMLDFEKWRPWFINSYWSDNESLQMGWDGLAGAAKYYGYYASPFILLLLLFIIYIIIRQNNFTPIKNKLFIITAPIFAVFFFFAEVSPRLNYHYLPERYWIFIGVTLIFIAIPLLKYAEEKMKTLKIFLALLLFCTATGLSGVIFIAQEKKALTSETEFEASAWIKKNTPANAVFVSQAANYPLIKYFSSREVFSPTESFFLGTEIEHEAQPEKSFALQKSKNEILAKMRADFESFLAGTIYFDEFEMRLRENKKILAGQQLMLEKQLPKITGPTYILYSTDKFNTLYAQRDWWQRANFYGANLEKFNRNFKLVYQNPAVKIWQIQ